MLRDTRRLRLHPWLVPVFSFSTATIVSGAYTPGLSLAHYFSAVGELKPASEARTVICCAEISEAFHFTYSRELRDTTVFFFFIIRGVMDVLPPLQPSTMLQSYVSCNLFSFYPEIV